MVESGAVTLPATRHPERVWKLRLATASIALLLTLLALFAALGAYVHHCRSRGRNVEPGALRGNRLVRRLFERPDFGALAALLSKGRPETFETVWDFGQSVALQRDQYVFVDMYGEPRYRHRPDVRIADFVVWSGLRNAAFAALETPELLAALERCDVVRRVSLETDSLGFRKTEFPVEPGTPSVLFLGDSFTEGLHVATGDTFVSRFGRMMSEAGLRAVPVNAGVNGYGTLEEAWTAETYARGLDARVVIENLFPNDAGDPREVRKDRAPKENYRVMFGQLERLAAYCEKNGLALVVSVIPAAEQFGGRSTPFQKRVRRWCSSRGVPFLNPLRYLRARGGPQNYLGWDPHLNEEGHRNYATFLFEQTLPLLRARFQRKGRPDPLSPR